MYTIYNQEEDRIEQVEEPDPSLTYTYSDYYNWNFLERLELLRGKIIRLYSPTTQHQEICGKLHFEVYSFLRGKTCRVFIPPFDVRLPVKNRKRDNEVTTVVQPDLSVFCDPAKIDRRGACGAPDLLVEILHEEPTLRFPGNSRYERQRKYDVYQEAGVKEYWIVDPPKERILVSILQEDGRFGPAVFYSGNQLLQPVSLPSFSIEAREVFIP